MSSSQISIMDTTTSNDSLCELNCGFCSMRRSKNNYSNGSAVNAVWTSNGKGNISCAWVSSRTSDSEKPRFKVQNEAVRSLLRQARAGARRTSDTGRASLFAQSA